MIQLNKTNSNPLVSIIIPCYNHGQFLEEAVISVLNSSYKNVEILIINDGSTDNSKQIAENLKDRYPNLIQIHHQENSGPSVARNKGISLSNGSLILPLDADDKIGKNYIQQGVHFLSSDPQIKIVYCQAEKFGIKTGLWKLKAFCPQALAKDNMIFVSAIFRKSDWQNIGGFDEQMKEGWEDWEFWINMLKRGGQVKQLRCIGFYYRIHNCSRRKSTNSEIKKKTIRLLNIKHKQFLDEQLGGPIRNPRSWSKIINQTINFWSTISGIENQFTNSLRKLKF